jgi:hypothetical protein
MAARGRLRSIAVIGSAPVKAGLLFRLVLGHPADLGNHGGFFGSRLMILLRVSWSREALIPYYP